MTALGLHHETVPRIDRASRVIAATPAAVFAAFLDPDALTRWLPPAGMSGRFDHFDPRTGGSYRMVLAYDDPTGSPGKTGEGSDVIEARFVDIVPGAHVAQEVDFESDDPAFSGTMIMTWAVREEAGGDGTVVELRAEHVPTGVSPTAHTTGMSSSLANLATLLER